MSKIRAWISQYRQCVVMLHQCGESAWPWNVQFVWSLMTPDEPLDLDPRGFSTEAEAAARYAHMVGLDLPVEERRARSREFSLGAPLIARRTPPAACDSHREPQGPNEDIAQCHICWAPTYSLRPEGETFGLHLADCALPERHLSYCQPGGSGHPRAPHVRG